MNLHEAYNRAKLLASDAAVATICEQLATLTARLEAPPTLAAHRVLAEKAPTEQSRSMHQALSLLLAQVCEDAPLCLTHCIVWAQLSRHFVVAGVRQAAAQFAIETEELLKALANEMEALRKERDEQSALRRQAEDEREELRANLAKAAENIAALHAEARDRRIERDLRS